MVDESDKRNRKANFTAAECAVILEEAEKHLDIIKSKFSNVITNKKKNEVWESIRQKVNALGVCVRTVQDAKHRGEYSKSHYSPRLKRIIVLVIQTK